VGTANIDAGTSILMWALLILMWALLISRRRETKPIKLSKQSTLLDLFQASNPMIKALLFRIGAVLPELIYQRERLNRPRQLKLLIDLNNIPHHTRVYSRPLTTCSAQLQVWTHLRSQTKRKRPARILPKVFPQMRCCVVRELSDQS
jgi:hypothetical protein